MHTMRGSWRRVGKAKVDMEVDAEVVEKKVGGRGRRRGGEEKEGEQL